MFHFPDKFYVVYEARGKLECSHHGACGFFLRNGPISLFSDKVYGNSLKKKVELTLSGKPPYKNPDTFSVKEKHEY